MNGIFTSASVRGLLSAMVMAVACWAALPNDQLQGQETKVTGARVYELRTYTTHPGRLEALNRRFRDHTMQIFEKHGIKNEGYWIPVDEKLRENTLIYIISHASEEAAQKSWAAFRADPEWQKVRDASEADGKIVMKVESVYMTKTDYSPAK